jgi:hypothetical protein
MIGIPQGGKDVRSARPHVHGNRGRITRHDIRNGRNSQNMAGGRDVVIVPATRDDVRNRSPIDLQIGNNIRTEVRRSDHNETTPLLSRGICYRYSRKDDKNQKQSAEDPHEIILAGLLSRLHALNTPERSVRAELGDFAGGTSANVNGDGNDTDKRTHENHRHDP